MASEVLVKRLLLQASVSVLAGLLLSSASLAEDSTDAARDTEISIGVEEPQICLMGFDGPDAPIPPEEMDSEAPDVAIAPEETVFEGPDVVIAPMEMEGMPVEATMMPGAVQQDAPTARHQMPGRGERQEAGHGYIWTRTESLK